MVTPLDAVSSDEKPFPVRSRYLVPLMVMLPRADRPAGGCGDAGAAGVMVTGSGPRRW